MTIKARTRYRTGRGIIEAIHSPCREHPEYMWSLGGNWYDKADGRFIRYVKDTDEHGRCTGGHYERVAMPTGLDLVEQFGETNDSYWDLVT
jgi:hypothetical protein